MPPCANSLLGYTPYSHFPHEQWQNAKARCGNGPRPTQTLQPRQNSPSTRGGNAGVKTGSLNTVEVGNGADADVGIRGGVDVGADIIVDVGASEVSPLSRP